MDKNKHEKKPTINFKNCIPEMIADLVVGIILLILDRLLG